MNIISTWVAAPASVRWASLLWFVLGAGAIASALYSLLAFLSLPVTGMTEIVVGSVGLEIAVAGLITLASWKLLLRVAWGRTVLEIATCISLVCYVGFGVIWLGAAFANWNQFKAEIGGFSAIWP
jgi:hypothetical protein